MEQQGARPVRDVLDVGAATGLSSLALLRAFPDASVTGVGARARVWLGLARTRGSCASRGRPAGLCTAACPRWSGPRHPTHSSARARTLARPLPAGIDLSPYMLAVGGHLQRQRNAARAAAGQPPEALRFVHGAGEDTRLPAESFDLVSVMLVRWACCAALWCWAVLSRSTWCRSCWCALVWCDALRSAALRCLVSWRRSRWCSSALRCAALRCAAGCAAPSWGGTSGSLLAWRLALPTCRPPSHHLLPCACTPPHTQVCHELPAAASQAIFKEAFRLLRPGGALAVMVRACARGMRALAGRPGQTGWAGCAGRARRCCCHCPGRARRCCCYCRRRPPPLRCAAPSLACPFHARATVAGDEPGQPRLPAHLQQPSPVCGLQEHGGWAGAWVGGRELAGCARTAARAGAPGRAPRPRARMSSRPPALLQEPWLLEYLSLDMPAAMTAAGFSAPHQLENSPRHKTVVAVKPRS